MSMTSPGSPPKHRSYKVSLADLDLETQKFTNKEAIKPWLLNCLARHKGIHVVIERSDTSKIIFKCKNKEKKTKVIEAKNINSKIQVRRSTSCPFKIRANFSLRNKVWTLSVVNDTHDHIISENDESIDPKTKDTSSSTTAVAKIIQHKTETTTSINKPSSSSSSSSSSLVSAVTSAVSTAPSAPGSSPEYSKRNAFLDQYVNEFPKNATSANNDVFTVLTSPSSSLPGQRDILFDAPFVLPKLASTAPPPPPPPPPAAVPPTKLPASSPTSTTFPTTSPSIKRKRSIPHIKKEDLKKRRRSMPLGLEPQPLFHDNNIRITPTRQEILESLRHEINSKVNRIMLDNIVDKSDVLESFVLQVIDDHWRYFSPRFMYRLRAMAEKKRRKSEVNLVHEQESDTVAAVVAAAEAAQAVEDAAVEAVAAGVVTAEDVTSEDPSKKSASTSMLNGWLNPPTPGMNSGQGNQTANLIPLSPLLNEDSDNDYNAAGNGNGGTNGGSGRNGYGNLVPLVGPKVAPETSTSHLPGLNVLSNLNSYLIGGSSQLQSIQNQSQQLPPFNSIQNKLPSPPNTHTMLNMSNTNTMVNSVFNISQLGNSGSSSSGSALIPLLSNSNTLNPSHLFKSSSKNNMGLGSSGNNLLNELKVSNSQYGTQSSTPQQFNNNSFSASFGLGQLNVRDNNNGGTGSTGGTGTGSGTGGNSTGLSSSILNNIGSFNDSGW